MNTPISTYKKRNSEYIRNCITPQNMKKRLSIVKKSRFAN